MDVLSDGLCFQTHIFVCVKKTRSILITRSRFFSIFSNANHHWDLRENSVKLKVGAHILL